MKAEDSRDGTRGHMRWRQRTHNWWLKGTVLQKQTEYDALGFEKTSNWNIWDLMLEQLIGAQNLKKYWSNVVLICVLRHCAFVPLLVKQLHLLSWPLLLGFKSSHVKLYNFVSLWGKSITHQFQREPHKEGMSWRIMSSPRGGWRGLERLVFQAVSRAYRP